MARDPRRAFRLPRRGWRGARADVDEELDFHLQQVEAELVAAGWSPEQARAEARRSFGDLEGTRARCSEVQSRLGREERRAMTVDGIVQDLRVTLRAVRRSPGYAALVVGTLAFGIAANTVVFSAMNPYLLRPLPYGHPDDLVQVNVANPVTGWDMDRLSEPQYLDWKARTRAFSGLAAYNYGAVVVTDAEGPERIQLARVTPDLFGVLQVEPALGRGFAPAEGRPGGDRVVILAESLWRRRYGADPRILGRAITLDGVKHTVVGVMPASFNFPFGAARMWIPLQTDPSSSRASNNLILVGRLAPGWTRPRALDELNGIHRELAARWPDADGRMSGATIKPLREALNFAWDVLSISFTVLLGAVVFVLLIACVNVASLTLARGSARAREIAVRASLGAGRGRIVRQLLTESLVLALAGGGLGVALSWWIAGLISPVLPEDLYRIGEIDVDGKVLAFSLGLTLLTPVAFGLLPALRASRVELAGALKQGGRDAGALSTSRTRRALVVAQVALAVVLVSGAGLMLRSFSAVRALDVGFDAGRVVVAEALLPANDYPDAHARLAWVDRAVGTLAAVPGIESASAATLLPLNHELFTTQVAPPELSSLPAEEWPVATLDMVAPAYFRTMGMHLLEGRDFVAGDGPGSAPMAVVSRALARRFWPDGGAVGRTLLAGDDPRHPDTCTVVGVVADARVSDLNQDDMKLQVYRPALQGNARRWFLVARTTGSPSALVAPVRRALGSADSGLPVEVRPMSAVVAENQLQWSIGSVFMGGFGAGAILLAMLGIYGLVAYSVAQRGKELGVRMALGATRGEIRRRVLADGVRLTAVGLLIGLAGAMGLGRLASSALYGVSPFDPVTLVAVLVLFLAVAAAASLLPAERASRADPVSALRAE
jgi:putative ABC transport system permease protein